jgi:hypothetical protein
MVADGQSITLRLTIADPVRGLTYSLQDKKSLPVNARIAGLGPLSFDAVIRLADGPRFLGEFVRSEGPERRFIYIALGQQAGDASTTTGGRAKIDIHTIPRDLLDQALGGAVLEVVLPGRDKAGRPALATLKPVIDWRAL